MKHVVILLSAVALFAGCHYNSESKSDDDSQTFFETETNSLTMSQDAIILDSLLAYQNVEADSIKKARHTWEWASQTRKALGHSEESNDLVYLDNVSFKVDKHYAPLTASSQADMNHATGMFAATACFRMLNAYQYLANQLSEFISEDMFLSDFTLWEEVYREYKEGYNNFGSSRPMMLNAAYKTIAELRLSILKEEIGYFSVDRDGAAEWFVNADEVQWQPGSKAIRAWYDHRMKMADRLPNENYSEYLRRITYKAVFIYNHLQFGWGYDFEKL